MKKLHVIDTLGAFTEPSDQPIVNWSKVNFSQLEQNGRLPASTRTRICNRFELYVQSVKRLGYDSVSFDDLAHLVLFDWYPSELKRLIADYDALYARLFLIAKQHDMKIFVNSDYMFTNQYIHECIETHNVTISDIFEEALEQLMSRYTCVDGVILRIGENDGKDVAGRFLSKLYIRTPAAANRLLKQILPVFEKYHKSLIFRTWTVGVYAIGDLIWNQATHDKVFQDITSDALIVSMKFGDTDFMRYLELNPLIVSTPQKKIIEFQTRREWEGMGTYPSFVGWDYEKYRQETAQNPTIIGTHTWCQTGGWAKKEWSNVTFLDDASFWNELNTFVTAQIFIHNQSTDLAIKLFCKQRRITDSSEFIRLLRLADVAVKQGIYISELAEHSYYFRRSRVPTLFWIAWDTPLLQPVAIYVVRSLIRRPDRAIDESREAADCAQEMLRIAKNLNLPHNVVRSLVRFADTLELFVYLKAYIIGTLHDNELQQLRQKRDEYITTHPDGYTIPPIPRNKRASKYRQAVSRYPIWQVFRTRRTYRKRDKVMLASSTVQRRFIQAYMKLSRSNLADQSMGFDSLFK